MIKRPHFLGSTSPIFSKNCENFADFCVTWLTLLAGLAVVLLSICAILGLSHIHLFATLIGLFLWMAAGLYAAYKKWPNRTVISWLVGIALGPWAWLVTLSDANE